MIKNFFPITIVFLLLCEVLFAQGGRIVLDGGYIHISSGKYLVIDNPSNTALGRTIEGGHIISEDENSNVKWNIGSTDATYTIPFGDSIAHYLPLTFTTDGGIGDGYIELATYGGATWKNSDYLPTGVNNFFDLGGGNNSAYAMDRFWKIKMRGYSSSNADKPSLSDLVFGYTVDEILSPNTVRERQVLFQRYNSILDSWYDYLPGGGDATVDDIAKTITLPFGIVNDEIYDWWVIVDKISPLPVELLEFNAIPQEDKVLLTWKTASENNSDKFIVERSTDGFKWEFIQGIPAKGFSNTEQSYECIDSNPFLGMSYYRLKQMDIDGSFTYSMIRTVDFNSNLKNQLVIYPNPTSEIINLKFNNQAISNSVLSLYNVSGQLVLQKDIIFINRNTINSINLNSLPQGTYFLRITSNQNDSEVFKVMKY